MSVKKNNYKDPDFELADAIVKRSCAVLDGLFFIIDNDVYLKPAAQDFLISELKREMEVTAQYVEEIAYREFKNKFNKRQEVQGPTS